MYGFIWIHWFKHKFTINSSYKLFNFKNYNEFNAKNFKNWTYKVKILDPPLYIYTKTIHTHTYKNRLMLKLVQNGLPGRWEKALERETMEFRNVGEEFFLYKIFGVKVRQMVSYVDYLHFKIHQFLPIFSTTLLVS